MRRRYGWMIVLAALSLTAPSLLAEVFRVPTDTPDRAYVELPAVWAFTAAADASAADPSLDDSRWASAPTAIERGAIPEGWDGDGWFRLRFDVPADGLYALRIRQRGASEVWLNGTRVATFGRLGEEPFEPQATGRVVISANGGRTHVLAIRYASPDVARFHAVGLSGGFHAEIGHATAALRHDLTRVRQQSGYLWFFTGIFLAFAALHLLLFAFTPAIRENLWFAFLCLSVAILAFFLFHREQMVNPRVDLVAERAMNVAGLVMGFCLLRFVYGIFLSRIPRQLTIYAFLALPVAIWSLPDAGAAMPFVFLLMLAAMLESARVVVVALLGRLSGALMVGAGVLMVTIGFGIGLLANLQVIEHNSATATLIPLGSVVLLLMMMSSYLSRQFALTNAQLREKLAEVELLSRQQIESERRMQQEQVERRLLEASYEQKVRELEEARELQLSMLPSRLPELTGVELAAHMETATEVGGDYYDFEVEKDGTLTIAVGDATGHGMRAGTMVTATKAIFGILSPGPDLPEVMARSTATIKRMNFRRLSMALTIAHYREGVLRLSSAAMPPVLIWRADDGSVEEIQLAGLPLGASARFPYAQATVPLRTGDAVLFMTDGFPERLSAEEELFGYERATESFQRAAAGTAAGIIDRLRLDVERWAGGRPTDDDVTFVVLKMK